MVVGAETVNFRGRQILDATLDSLLAAGLKDAELLIVNGCSAVSTRNLGAGVNYSSAPTPVLSLRPDGFPIRVFWGAGNGR